jgi:hypothetical protein
MNRDDITDLRKAAEEALKVLESIGQMDMYPEDWAVTVALRAALEQNPIKYYGHDGKQRIRIDPETGDVGIGG